MPKKVIKSKAESSENKVRGGGFSSGKTADVGRDNIGTQVSYPFKQSTPEDARMRELIEALDRGISSIDDSLLRMSEYQAAIEAEKKTTRRMLDEMEKRRVA